MRDHYSANQAGAMGPSSKAEGNLFQQVGAETNESINFSVLSDELSTLRQILGERAASPEEILAVAEVTQAQLAATKGDGPSVLRHLKSAGGWALDLAKAVGMRVVVDMFAKAM